MRFSINLSGKTLYTYMRACGYTSDGPSYVPGRKFSSGRAGETKFHRFLVGRFYPKFHAYCVPAEDAKTVTVNLHLDQKQPSYRGSHAHNAEHGGPLLEAEAARIQALSR